jgi:hypothetical protein
MRGRTKSGRVAAHHPLIERDLGWQKQKTGRQHPSWRCINVGFANAEGISDEKPQHLIPGAFCHRALANDRTASAFASQPAFAAERFV